MARKQEAFKVETTDGECEILLTVMDGNTGGMLGVKLAQMFGPGILNLVSSMESKDLAKVSSAANEVLSKFTPAEFETLTKQLLKGAQAQIGEEFIDVNASFIAERFAGHPGSLFRLVFLALRLNFADFFRDLGLSAERIANLKAKLPTH